MINRLKTSKESKKRLEDLNRVLKMSNNAIILRYAISKSIICDKDIMTDVDAIVNDTNGFEINRQTLFGDNEIIYKLLINSDNLDDDQLFFPNLINKHIERGLKILEREYKFAGNKTKFMTNTINKMEI